MTCDPSLQQIVDGPHRRDAKLAREIQSLAAWCMRLEIVVGRLEGQAASLQAEILHCARTDYVDGIASSVGRVLWRLEALEGQARDYQEDGHLASEDFPLEQQRDDWRARAERNERTVSLLRGQHCTLNANYDVLLAQRDAARAALRKYGRHATGCPNSLELLQPYHCTCGLSDALAGGEANEGSGDGI